MNVHKVVQVVSFESAIIGSVLDLINANRPIYCISVLDVDKWMNSRYTISIGALGKDERHASYSAGGPGLFLRYVMKACTVLLPHRFGSLLLHITDNGIVSLAIHSGPGSDLKYETGHIVAGRDGSCGNAGEGTSLATAAVGGGIALLLHANPNLGWRELNGFLLFLCL